jgi:hypothetical protein
VSEVYNTTGRRDSEQADLGRIVRPRAVGEEQLLGLGEDEAFEVRACDKKESVRSKCEKRFGKRNKGDYEDGASRGGYGFWGLGRAGLGG